MKAYPEHDQSWVASLPYYGTVSKDASGRLTRVICAGMFAGSRSRKREDIEGGFTPSFATTEEQREYNRIMTQQVAAFADITGQYTAHLYGRARTLAIFKALSIGWHRRAEFGFGQRGWWHSVCQEAMT